MKESLFKAGDKVVCAPRLPMPENKGTVSDPTYGLGYEEGKKFTIHSMTFHKNTNSWVYWPGPFINGVLEEGLMLDGTQFFRAVGAYIRYLGL